MTSLVIKAGMKQGGFTDAQREVTVPSFQSVMLKDSSCDLGPGSSQACDINVRTPTEVSAIPFYT